MTQMRRLMNIISESWDHYTEIGHKKKSSIVYYMMPGGQIQTHAFNLKRDNHDMGADGPEAKAIAVGRIDPKTKKISVRTPLAPGNAFYMIPQAKLDFIAGKLKKLYPDYEIWYFGNAATDIRRIDEAPVDDEENDDTGPRSMLGVARWFQGVYDDLDGDEPVKNAKQALTVIRENYLTGDCDAFAAALHLRTGWPILKIAEKGRHHTVVQASNGKLVDFSGYTTIDAIRKRFHFVKAVGKPITLAATVHDSLDELDEDPWHAIRIADFVLGQLHRPPFNTLPPSKLKSLAEMVGTTGLEPA